METGLRQAGGDAAAHGQRVPVLALAGETGAERVRVLVVSEVRLYREGLARALRAHAWLEVLNGEDGAEPPAAGPQPQVVLMGADLVLRKDALGRLRSAWPGARVVAFGVDDDPPEVLALAEAGVVGYLTRSGSIEELVATIRDAVRDELRCSPRVAASVFRRIADLAAERRRGPAATLTAREAEVAELLDRGCSNKEIARRLAIRTATVKNHVHSILEKLQVRRREEAAAALRRVASRAAD